MVCVPLAEESCYSGPPGTVAVALSSSPIG